MNARKLYIGFLSAALAVSLPLLAAAQSSPMSFTGPQASQPAPPVAVRSPYLAAIVHACEGKSSGAACSYEGRRSQLSGVCSVAPPPQSVSGIKGGDVQQSHPLYCRLVPGSGRAQ